MFLSVLFTTNQPFALRLSQVECKDLLATFVVSRDATLTVAKVSEYTRFMVGVTETLLRVYCALEASTFAPNGGKISQPGGALIRIFFYPHKYRANS